MHHYEYYKDFLYKKEADQLLEFLETSIPWTQVKYFKPERGYVVTPRLTWVAGFHQKEYYNLSNCIPNKIPEFLFPLKDLVENYTEQKYNFMLFSKYRNEKDSITYHSDDEKFLGKNPTISSLTLGSSRPFVLKHKKSRASEVFDLSHGDLFVMKNNCQKDYFHALPKQETEFLPRYSITFRNALNEHGSNNYYTYNLGKKI